MAEESDKTPFYTPVNEISFWSWAGGEVAYINPFKRGRGLEFKRQLVRASIEAIEAIWSVDPEARIVQPEPLINVVADPSRPQDRDAAERWRLSQYEAWDMLAGRQEPQLGGAPEYLDIVGVNYYSTNQWMLDGTKLDDPEDPLYRPLPAMLQEAYERYGRPFFMAETGIEGEERPAWLRYIGEEVRKARALGVPVEGICIYPIFDYPGWDDDRYCPCGLWGYADENGERLLYEPLAREQALMKKAWRKATATKQRA